MVFDRHRRMQGWWCRKLRLGGPGGTGTCLSLTQSQSTEKIDRSRSQKFKFDPVSSFNQQFEQLGIYISTCLVIRCQLFLESPRSSWIPLIWPGTRCQAPFRQVWRMVAKYDRICSSGQWKLEGQSSLVHLSLVTSACNSHRIRNLIGWSTPTNKHAIVKHGLFQCVLLQFSEFPHEIGEWSFSAPLAEHSRNRSSGRRRQSKYQAITWAPVEQCRYFWSAKKWAVGKWDPYDTRL